MTLSLYPWTIRPARLADLDTVEALLRVNDLPAAGVADWLERGYRVAEDDAGSIIGVAGIEVYRPFGLIRSVAVTPSWHGRGVGRELALDRMNHAYGLELEAVYLLTLTAEGYWRRHGFAVIPRSEIPAPLHASEEWRGACPETATAMALWLRAVR